MKKENLNPLISIIVVNYNGLKYIERLLQSLRTQTYKNVEIIVVDSDSKDGSKEKFRQTEKITLIETNNLGYAYACNTGVEFAKGDFIMIVNNDVWFDANFIKSLYLELIDRKLDVIAPVERLYNGDDIPIYVNKIDPFGHPVFLFGKNYKNEKPFYLSGSCLLFSKSLYQLTLGLDPKFFMYFEETDWFWRLNLFNKSFAYSRSVKINHAGASVKTSEIKEKTFLWRNENVLQMLIKNYSLISLLIILPIYFLLNLFEIIIFFILLKPRISLTFLQAWLFNINNLGSLIERRKFIQKNRIVSDRLILSKMYFGFGKVHHFLRYLCS